MLIFLKCLMINIKLGVIHLSVLMFIFQYILILIKKKLVTQNQPQITPNLQQKVL